MNGLDELFQLEFQGETGGVCRFRCQTDHRHPLFAGHFPGMPIIPGVCLLNAVKRAVSLKMGHVISFAEIRECKFLSAINPLENRVFEVEFGLIDDGQEVRAAVFVGDTQCVKLKATLSNKWKDL